MNKILAIYGSPRRKGNTSTLLNRAVEGASAAGAEVEKVFLRDLKMSPCLEIYGCKETGLCVIQDDFQKVCDKLLASHGIMLSFSYLLLHGERPHQDLHGSFSIPLGQEVLD